MSVLQMFDGVVEFIAVVEAQGFSAAAKRLNVSTSHVSRRVSALEKRLGIVLLARSTRKVRLTEVGEQYYQQCCEIMDGFLEANENVGQQQTKLEGTLRVSLAGDFAERFVAPCLTEFAKRYPQLRVEFDFNSRLVDFVEAGIDLAIRYGNLEDSSLIARKLVMRRLIAAASEEYLKANGVPNHPNELLNHSCLVASNNRWVFTKGAETVELRVQGRVRCNTLSPLLNACEEGLGICYLPQSSYRDYLETGRLQTILDEYSQTHTPTWIVYANRRYVPARVRLAVNFLLEWFADPKWHITQQ